VASAELLPGDYNVSVVAGALEQSRRVTLAPTAGADLLFVLPGANGSGRLRGRVVGWHDGAPIADARVVVQWRKEAQVAGQLAELVTDEDGRFELADAPAGELYLFASDRRYDPFDKRRAEQRGRGGTRSSDDGGPRFGEAHCGRTLARDATIDVVLRVLPAGAPPPGAPRVALDLVAREAATGLAIAGCDVHVSAIADDGALAEAGRFVADGEGRVTAELAVAFRYEVVLFSPRHAWKQLLVAPEGGRLTVDATLTPPPGR
jgi:hypothetical protein